MYGISVLIEKKTQISRWIMLFNVVEAAAPPETENVIEIAMKGKVICVNIFVCSILLTVFGKCFKFVVFRLISYSFVMMA
jgi:hypothetical protein